MGRIADIKPRPLSPELDPWERQPGETEKGYRRFLQYRDQTPTRSMRRLAQDQGVTQGAINETAKRESWTARVAAWDRHLRQEEDAAMIAARREAGRRHAALTSSHLAALALSTRELARRANEDPRILEGLPIEQLLRVEAAMARATPRLVVAERLALGMSTENVNVHDDREREISQASDQDLDAQLVAGGVGGAMEFMDGLEAGAAMALSLAAEAAERAGAS